MSQSGKVAWGVVTALALSISLMSLGVSSGGMNDLGCCLPDNGGCLTAFSDECEDIYNGSFSSGQVCGADNASCRDEVFGCCEFEQGCLDNFSEISCGFIANSTLIEDAVCGSENNDGATSGFSPGSCATYTPTATATATATNTRVPDGGSCVDPGDCESGNCVDDVCCDTACEAPNQACNVPGSVGTCSDEIRAPAPAVSGIGLLVALLGLLAIGISALRLRRRVQV